MDTRNKSTAKTPETGEALAKVKASGRAWLRAVQQDKERKETQERSQEKAAPMASRQDDDDEVNYNEEASEQVGDPSKGKEVEPSELSSEEEEGDSQPVGEEEKNPKAPEEEDPRNMGKDLRVSQTTSLGKQHPYFRQGRERLKGGAPKEKKGKEYRDRFDVNRSKWEALDWLKFMIR